MATIKDQLAAALKTPVTPLVTANALTFTTYMVPFSVGVAQPDLVDSVPCQLWLDGGGVLHVYNGTAWKALKYDP